MGRLGQAVERIALATGILSVQREDDEREGRHGVHGALDQRAHDAARHLEKTAARLEGRVRR